MKSNPQSLGYKINAQLVRFTYLINIYRDIFSITEMQPTWKSFGYWFKFYRHRIIRLWFPLAAVLFSISTRHSVTYYHALWPTVDQYETCNKNWWQNLLFLNSLFPNTCLPWYWYIGTDFIFYLLAPIFLLAIRGNPVFGIISTLFVMLASMLLRAILMVIFNFPPTQFLWFQSYFNVDMVSHHVWVYTKPYTRISTYLVGILLGYFLASCSKPFSEKLREKSNKHTLLLWLLASVLMFWGVFGLYPAAQGWGSGQDWFWFGYNIFYGATHRVVFVTGLAIFIALCHEGHGGWVNRILSCRIMVPLSNISYGVYLVHLLMILIFYLWYRPFPLHWYGHHVQLLYLIPAILMSYLGGLITFICWEMPPLNIEQYWLRRAADRKNKKDTVVSGR